MTVNRPRLVAALAPAIAAAWLAAGIAVAAPPPGPPFPDPILDVAVYDHAGVFDEATVASAEATIDAIEARTGAEIAVYTQVVDYGVTTAQAEAHARALMDQWGVGRRGFDDGLVILFDLDPSLIHGQVNLYAGAGFRATFLTDGERQRIFDDDMLPYLRGGDLDGALLVALERIDAATTPENAERLSGARVLDAVLGLLVAPIAFLAIVGFAAFRWLRFGRDPVYLDDPSIHMPAPPPDLTAAAGAVVMDGRTGRRAFTTAMLDLASRGALAFREETTGLFGLGGRKVGIHLDPPAEDEAVAAQRARNDRRPMSSAERYLGDEVRALRYHAEDGSYVAPEHVPALAHAVGDFEERLEQHVVDRGWMTARPKSVILLWLIGGIGVGGAGIGLLFAGFNLPSGGLVTLGIAVGVAGIIVAVLSQVMPAVTMPGAMVRAMLAAYRRTLEKTMAGARSMQGVVDGAGLPWLETPDQAVVWGTALGLQTEIEAVLARSLEDARDGRAAPGTYFPAWYLGSDGQPVSAASAGSGGGGGLFSSSPIPSFGGMMAVLGTVGSSPSSGGDGGGFGGGGGGGGGGAGGGF